MSLVFITQFYFFVPIEDRLNSTHYLKMQIHNKRELQQIAFNHSADIYYKDLIKIYKKCTSKPYLFLNIGTTLPVNNSLRCSKNILDSLQK